MRSVRAVPRVGVWVAAVVFLVGAGCLARLHQRSRSVRLQLTVVAATLPADGAYHPALRVRRSDGKRIVSADMRVSGLPSRVSIDLRGDALIALQSPGIQGRRRLQFGSFGLPVASTEIGFVTDTSDHFHDGTPEFLRLHTAADQVAFRNWFTALADFASTLPPEQLPHEIGDCAALLRWCYRNALHAHNEAWQDTMPFSAPPPLPSVQQYVWPETTLGKNLFRVRSGSYASSDPKDGTFAQFADARSLMLQNAFLVSRHVDAALPGDLLFYRQLEQNSPFHSMIVTGGGGKWAVYHTGPIGRGPGEMRRVLMRDLQLHPDRRWRPDVDNENFLGVYRWNILRQDGR